MPAAQQHHDTSNAGWYPDPARSHMLRYWDGQSWTDRLAQPGTTIEPQYAYAADGSIIRVHQYA